MSPHKPSQPPRGGSPDWGDDDDWGDAWGDTPAPSRQAPMRPVDDDEPFDAFAKTAAMPPVQGPLSPQAAPQPHMSQPQQHMMQQQQHMMHQQHMMQHAPQPDSQGMQPYFTPQQIERGKTMATLCHAANAFGIPFWVVPLFVTKDNAFATWHAKQAAAGWIAFALALTAVSGVAVVTCFGAALYLLLPIVGSWPALYAWQGQARPFPIIGPITEDFLKNFHADKDPEFIPPGA